MKKKGEVFTRSFYLRQRVANLLGRWADRWLLSEWEILEWNEHVYDCQRDYAGLS